MGDTLKEKPTFKKHSKKKKKITGWDWAIRVSQTRDFVSKKVVLYFLNIFFTINYITYHFIKKEVTPVKQLLSIFALLL